MFTKKRKPIQVKLNPQWKECQNSHILALKEMIKRRRSWSVITPVTKKRTFKKRITKGEKYSAVTLMVM